MEKKNASRFSSDNLDPRLQQFNADAGDIIKEALAQATDEGSQEKKEDEKEGKRSHADDPLEEYREKIKQMEKMSLILLPTMFGSGRKHTREDTEGESDGVDVEEVVIPGLEP